MLCKTYIKNKVIERFKNLTDEEKEDIGLLLLMQEADMDDKISEEEVFGTLIK